MSSSRRDALGIVTLTVLLLAPFAGKAFHMDDPLFVWAAQHIRVHPADFYGFDVNWYGVTHPMSSVMKNPPGASYYLALLSLIAGGNETALHLGFLVPAAALAFGTYVLARDLTSRPFPAALATVLTPVFAVSSTSVMSDTMMVAFWVWAVVLWRRGRERGETASVAGAGLLIALAGLTKYYGVALIPLLALDGILRRRGRKAHLLALLIPVLAFIAYQRATAALYGHGLLLDAASYASEQSPLREAPIATVMVGLAFTGGCLAAASLGSLVTSGRYALLATAAAGLAAAAVLARLDTLGEFALKDSPQRWAIIVQVVAMALGGLHVLALAGTDAWRRRDADAILLALWLGGTVLFSTALNWTISARTFLPAAPAAAILLARRLDARAPRTRGLLPAALAAAGLLTVGATRADYALAGAARHAAGRLAKLVGDGRTLWFQGHWGFQYYMEKGGGKALDRAAPRLAPGDRMAIPLNATNTFNLPPDTSAEVGFIEERLPSGVSVMSHPTGAGFYSALWGPLPFAVGPAPAEQYVILQVLREVRAPLD